MELSLQFTYLVSAIHGCREKKFLLLFPKKGLSIYNHSVKTIKKCLSIDSHSFFNSVYYLAISAKSGVLCM